jgi:hypothetical protein
LQDLGQSNGLACLPNRQNDADFLVWGVQMMPIFWFGALK